MNVLADFCTSVAFLANSVSNSDRVDTECRCRVSPTRGTKFEGSIPSLFQLALRLCLSVCLYTRIANSMPSHFWQPFSHHLAFYLSAHTTTTQSQRTDSLCRYDNTDITPADNPQAHVKQTNARMSIFLQRFLLALKSNFPFFKGTNLL